MTESPLPLRQQQLIGGQWITGQGDTLKKYDPVSGVLIYEAATASPAQVNQAISAARDAFYEWARLDYAERVDFVERFRTRLEARKPELAHLIAQETGKPYWEALTEVGAMVGKVAISLKAYDERTPVREKAMAEGRATLRHRPHGVLAVFGPYNFPGHLPNGHIIPALLAGNTIVFKPSELTPATADLTLQCWLEAGLPDGVINLVQGEVKVGQTLSQGEIDGLLFTGSARTGQLLHRQFAGQTGQLLALELGGNNPVVVLPDADPAAAAVLLVQSAFISGGQRCTCARRILLPEGEAGDRLLEAFLRAVDGITVGGQFDEPAPFMGGVASPQAAQDLLAAQQSLLAGGARSLREMKLLREGTSLLSPGVIDVTGCDVPDEEYFGPLTKVTRYRDWQEALTLANDTRYGLAAGLIGGSAGDWEDFTLRIRAGVVNWNRQTTGASSDAPFGGVGDSGNHRPSAFYAADYVAWPMASLENDTAVLPASLPTGLNFRP
ncbi:succinylglutamate-semialdehyde dehydrogenase [Terasakiispira papahanaumokuakeensis]|uniref:N-succinylglutamate 5-semialdehyde dehydrogenase n=1 Tax=Terasakiispira papahanaumokuakeensis TaxID=197479 RepID=A0A1E2VBL5_9GAMM|nr:succinylglutamate-semialdehyde dehydrogenase [Terasakiispira papahanaumokuakeensis]ODC04361.1 succinylglutamate-semialdehyde dehydrogenase [Terasakiispira papahanaumokuakeensis]